MGYLGKKKQVAGFYGGDTAKKQKELYNNGFSKLIDWVEPVSRQVGSYLGRKGKVEYSCVNGVCSPVGSFPESRRGKIERQVGNWLSDSLVTVLNETGKIITDPTKLNAFTGLITALKTGKTLTPEQQAQYQSLLGQYPNLSQLGLTSQTPAVVARESSMQKALPFIVGGAILLISVPLIIIAVKPRKKSK
ncbi:MAG: hypothetical protein PHX21_12855 [bacterium]|nr:hypothetical protein [bacterium]